MIDENELVFPILTFFENGDYQPYPTEKDFLVTDKQSIHKGQFRNIKIVDSTGCLYKVQDVKIKKPFGLLNGYHPLYKNRLYRIKLVLEFDYKLTLSELKNQLINATEVLRVPDSITLDKQTEIRKINHQKSIESLVKILNM